MPLAVVVGGTIQCPHSGTARFTSGSSELQVDGKDVIVAGQETNISFAPGSPAVLVPCSYVHSTSGAPSPCAASLSATSGISTKLTVNNTGVLLDNAGGLVQNPDPAVTGMQWSIADAGQSKLEVDS